jgi:hypothetical protein
MAKCEEWKDIPGISTHQASNTGKLRSKQRTDIVQSPRCKKPFFRKRRGIILSSTKTDNGYLLTSINDRTFLVHRLIAKTFIENPNNLPEINHINGNKSDNNIENLEWTTRSNNEKHAYCILGKKTWNAGKPFYNPSAYRTRKENYLKKCLMVFDYKQKTNKSTQSMAIEFGLSKRQIQQRLKNAKEVMSI